MTAESQFLQMLAADADVVAIVGERIALNALPQGVDPPYILFSSSHEPQQMLDGEAEDKVTFSVECWAPTAVDALVLSDKVAAAIVAFDAADTTGLSVTVLSRQGVYDPDLQLDGVTLSVEWWP